MANAISIPPDKFSRSAEQRSHRAVLRSVGGYSTPRNYSRIDVKSPLFYSSTFFRLKKTKEDFFALKRIMRDNVSLLVKINNIDRNHALTITRNTNRPIPRSYLLTKVQRVREIEAENFRFGCKLLSVRSLLNTKLGYQGIIGEKRRAADIKKDVYMVSKQLLKAYSAAVLPQDQRYMRRLLRPKIFMDLEVKNIRPLGRVFVQLFTEACPEVVLEFVRMCTHNSIESFNFIRIFPNLWIEGEIKVQNEILSSSEFVYKLHAVDHGCGAGVLSFAKTYLDGFPAGIINFTISFKPLPVLQGNRVPFGVVLSGFRVLDCLQDYGTKNGKTKKDIVIVKFGVVR